MELLKTNTLRKVKEGDAEWRFVEKKIKIKMRVLFSA